MKTYFVTWAQSGTPVHAKFWAAVMGFKARTKAEVIVIPGRYKNPTSRWEDSRMAEDTYAPEVESYIVGKRVSLCKNLRVYGDIKIQPTGSRPLQGFELFCGRVSAILGHPRGQMQVVPTAEDMPKVMWTTGACTVKNYSDSKAGKKGQAHHVTGGLVVEVQRNGQYFVRRVTFVKDGFTDLNTRYGSDGSVKTVQAAAVQPGDWHSGQVDPDAYKATKALVQVLKPVQIHLHDVLDFRTRNHHERNQRARYQHRDGLVQTEVEGACSDIAHVQGWNPESCVKVIRSNHDEALDRWLEECDHRTDPRNTPYWHGLWCKAYDFFTLYGFWPNLFLLEFHRLFPSRINQVEFRERDEPLMVAGVRCDYHGDIGANGARGSVANFVKLGCKVNIGHGHTPAELDGVCMAGVMNRRMHYNRGPSGWLVCSIVTHVDGSRQMVICIGPKYRGG